MYCISFWQLGAKFAIVDTGEFEVRAASRQWLPTGVGSYYGWLFAAQSAYISHLHILTVLVQ